MFFLNGHNSSIFKALTSASVVSMLALAPTSHVIRTKACCKSQEADSATERECQLTAGNLSERTECDFRCPINCCSSFGQACCLICAHRCQLMLLFCC